MKTQKKSPSDLFVPVVEKARWHPNFSRLYGVATQNERTLLNEWRDGFADRDGNFAIEFQTKFNSAFWELYLFACLKELRLTANFKHNRPDFVIDGAAPLIMEAVTTGSAVDGTPEWSRDLNQVGKLGMQEIVDTATIRLANSITSKHKKYQDEYKHLPHVKERPFVIAVAPFEQPFFFMQNQQAILRVLYGINSVSWVPGLEGALAEFETIDEIRKPNGAPISLGLFTDLQMRHVSAIAYSNTATWSKIAVMARSGFPGIVTTQRYDDNSTQPKIARTPIQNHNERLIEGMNIYHNPFADYPLNAAAFSHPDITHSWVNGEFPLPFSNCRDGALYQRNLLSFRNQGKTRPSV